jgi:hypothetical protein
MNGIDWEITDNSEEAITALELALSAMLEEIGLKVEAYAKANITAAGRVDTGQYRNSITHRVRLDERAVYVGSNLEHTIYNELGTGKYATDGNGRPGYWVYVAGQDRASRAANRAATRKIYTLAEAKRITAYLRSKGLNAFYTCGMKPTHALQKAASEHNSTYLNVIQKHMMK